MATKRIHWMGNKRDRPTRRNKVSSFHPWNTPSMIQWPSVIIWSTSALGSTKAKCHALWEICLLSSRVILTRSPSPAVPKLLNAKVKIVTWICRRTVWLILKLLLIRTCILQQKYFEYETETLLSDVSKAIISQNLIESVITLPFRIT